jgi:ferritin-like metal-binding protein YciE
MHNGNTRSHPGVSDLGYDIITLLQSKLEAVDIYPLYIEDATEAGDAEIAHLLEQILRQDEQHIEMLTGALERLVNQGMLRGDLADR